MFRLARTITPDEVAAFNMAGVVLLRGVLDLRAVNSLRRFIDDATDTLSQSPAGYNLSAVTRAAEDEAELARMSGSGGQYNLAGLASYVKATGEPILVDTVEQATGSFILDTGVSSRLVGLKQHCVRGGLPEIAAALLQSDRVNFLGDQIFVKEPRTREKTAFHQDAPYFEIEGEQCCVLWIPVDPVTARNGGMRYVRGSHRGGGSLSAPNLFVTNARMPGSEGEMLPDIDAHPERYDIVQFDVEPGDILVHHYKTIHGAGGNLSRYQVRRAASLRYTGDIRFHSRPGVPPQLHHTTRLNDGAALMAPISQSFGNARGNRLPSN